MATNSHPLLELFGNLEIYIYTYTQYFSKLLDVFNKTSCFIDVANALPIPLPKDHPTIRKPADSFSLQNTDCWENRNGLADSSDISDITHQGRTRHLLRGKMPAESHCFK